MKQRKSPRLAEISALCAALLVFLLISHSAPASASNEANNSGNDAETVSYTISAQDTLYGIASRYLVSSKNARDLQRFNQIRDPRRLRINSTLKIPRTMLRHQPVELRVVASSGPVRIEGQPPTVGRVLKEGDTIETMQNGFISFSGGRGVQISLPSNTTASLVKARRYVLGNILDVDFAVSRGRANAVSPTLEGQDRLRMRTPLAVTAVRGTQFRVAYNPDSGDYSLTEVTEGVVQVAAGGEALAAPAGFGVSSTASGVSEPEELLPSPQFNDPGAVQTDETLNFAISPVEGASSYRVQLAKDAGFLDVITEQIVSEETVTFPGIENGRYQVRARSISPNGLEGINSDSFSFLRKRVGASAQAGSSPDYDGYNFSWLAQGEENATFAFQLWAEDAPATLMVDEVGLDASQIIITDLAPGRYVWRVAASVADAEAGLIKVWGPAQTLVVSQ